MLLSQNETTETVCAAYCSARQNAEVARLDWPKLPLGTRPSAERQTAAQRLVDELIGTRDAMLDVLRTETAGCADVEGARAAWVCARGASQAGISRAAVGEPLAGAEMALLYRATRTEAETCDTLCDAIFAGWRTVTQDCIRQALS